MGGRGASSGTGKAVSLAEHFAKENARMEKFLEGRGDGSIEMDSGQIIERYTMEYMKNSVLKEFKENEFMPADNGVSIRYKNGNIEAYTEGDDTSKMKLSNIDGVIFENDSTTAYAGRGIKAMNYKELYPKEYPDEKGYEDDWRLDFT